MNLINAGCKSVTNNMEQMLGFVKDEKLRRLVSLQKKLTSVLQCDTIISWNYSAIWRSSY